MGVVTTTTFTSDTETVTRAKLNALVANLLTEFNGSIDNNNIKAAAAIAYSKLNLATSILNADISASAGIVDTKLATLSTAGKVSGAALTSLASIPSGAGAIPIVNLPVTSMNVGLFTRDMTAASGSSSVTGVGFVPTAIIFLAAISGTISGSWGFVVGSSKGSMFRDTGVAKETVSNSACITIYQEAGGGANQYANVSSFDSDGFTLSWTKFGSPTGTANITYLAIR